MQSSGADFVTSQTERDFSLNPMTYVRGARDDLFPFHAKSFSGA